MTRILKTEQRATAQYSLVCATNPYKHNKANHADSPLARLSGVGRRYANTFRIV